MKNYYVYVHIAPNLKKYIGITCQKPTRRWHGGSGYKNQPKFYNAIQKYGWENFYHGILLENLTEKLACEMEQYLIDKFDTINNGYNQTTGGEYCYHHVVSDSTRKKISIANKGRTLSDSHKEKCITQLEINRLNRQRCVYCVETGDIFNSIKEAADTYGLNTSHITHCCQGKRKTTGNFHWKYWEVEDGTLGRTGTN